MGQGEVVKHTFVLPEKLYWAYKESFENIFKKQDPPKKILGFSVGGSTIKQCFTGLSRRIQWVFKSSKKLFFRFLSIWGCFGEEKNVEFDEPTWLGGGTYDAET